MPAADSSGGELLGALAASAAFIALMGLVSWLIFRRAEHEVIAVDRATAPF